MKTNTLIGSKYFTYENGNPTPRVIRLIRIKNIDCFVMRDMVTGEDFKVSKSVLIEKYTRLTPDGYVSFSIVKLDDNANDVMVTFHRNSDMKDGSAEPYAVCRQSIYDLFTNAISNISKDKSNIRPVGVDVMYIGTSVSKDSCPDGVDFKVSYACNGVVEMATVAIYMDDTLDDILNFVSLYKFNRELISLKEKMNKVHSEVNMGVKYEGYCDSVKQLLTENYFMLDVHRGFKIVDVDFPLDFNDNFALVDYQVQVIEDIIKCGMTGTCVIRYDKDIDIKNITRNYILVCDGEKKLYVILYNKGEYVNKTYMGFDDKSELEMLSKLGGINPLL